MICFNFCFSPSIYTYIQPASYGWQLCQQQIFNCCKQFISDEKNKEKKKRDEETLEKHCK